MPEHAPGHSRAKNSTLRGLGDFESSADVARTDQTMRLENQAVSKSRMVRARDEQAAELSRGDRRLWADE